MKNPLIFCCCLLLSSCGISSSQSYTAYVNPLLGTETLWEEAELGYKPTRRAWGAEVFPGSALPNAMVQVSPVTTFRSGAGYQYEDSTIYGFSHTNKGHWNLNYVPILPVCGDDIRIDDYGSTFRHENETARPAYYRVHLDRYGIEAELTSTLRCGFHRYTPDEAKQIMLLVNLPRNNERVEKWHIAQASANAFSGYQAGRETIYFYAECNYPIQSIEELTCDGGGIIPDSPVAPGSSSAERYRGVPIPLVKFQLPAEPSPLEIKIGFSFVSIEGAQQNLKAEIGAKSFEQIAKEGDQTWNKFLSKIQVTGGTERQKETFYSALYRSTLWPALRSDVDGRFCDLNGKIQQKDFRYYTDPAFWDTYRNKLILLGMLSPDVAADVIASCIDRGQIKGYMPTFFHGDHASVFVTGSYLRGIRNFDVQEAYRLMLHNATVEGESNSGRPYLGEYIANGYVSELELDHPEIATEAKTGVTKTLEYAYDDYAVARLAQELGDEATAQKMLVRSQNYRQVFDPQSRFMRGRLADDRWVADFDPGHPYYHYMYREANGWQSSFFAPHDTKGLIDLYGGAAGFEEKLDSLFSTPWQGYEAHNLTGFLGQYCHGNQPDHSYPFLYHFIGKPEKSQVVIDSLLENYYRMGAHGLAYAGMDDAGEMSSWYVFSAIGLYPYSPADPEYLVSVPLFDSISFELGGQRFSIHKTGPGRNPKRMTYGGKNLKDYKISHTALLHSGKLTIETQ